MRNVVYLMQKLNRGNVVHELIMPNITTCYKTKILTSPDPVFKWMSFMVLTSLENVENIICMQPLTAPNKYIL